ncbi:uncharacterized protein LW94_5567 [Fusarium fujikuroi]|nr:uncharacterized protein LW94_5567 [Fusarium fujikuroi]
MRYLRNWTLKTSESKASSDKASQSLINTDNPPAIGKTSSPAVTSNEGTKSIKDYFHPVAADKTAKSIKDYFHPIAADKTATSAKTASPVINSNNTTGFKDADPLRDQHYHPLAFPKTISGPLSVSGQLGAPKFGPSLAGSSSSLSQTSPAILPTGSFGSSIHKDYSTATIPGANRGAWWDIHSEETPQDTHAAQKTGPGNDLKEDSSSSLEKTAIDCNAGKSAPHQQVIVLGDSDIEPCTGKRRNSTDIGPAESKKPKTVISDSESSYALTSGDDKENRRPEEGNRSGEGDRPDEGHPNVPSFLESIFPEDDITRIIEKFCTIRDKHNVQLFAQYLERFYDKSRTGDAAIRLQYDKLHQQNEDLRRQNDDLRQQNGDLREENLELYGRERKLVDELRQIIARDGEFKTSIKDYMEQSTEQILEAVKSTQAEMAT